MSKVKRGTAGEFIFKAKALLAGFNIFAEENQDSKCDCILQKDEPLQLHRMQIKVLNPQGQLPTRKLTHSKTKHTQSWYTKSDIDYLVGVDLDTYDVYIVPVSFFSKFTSVVHKDKLEQYKNNFNLQEPYLGNWVSASPQVGETVGNGNTELGDNKPSVETLRGIPKFNLKDLEEAFQSGFYSAEADYNQANGKTFKEFFKDKYGKDKVQRTNNL